MMCLGFSLRRRNIISEKTAQEINKISFKIFIPLLVFNNIYGTKLKEVINLKLFVFTIASVFVIWLISIALAYATEKSPETRAVMIQGMFRSNYTLYGLPVIIFLFGAENAGVTSFLVSIIIPTFNILAIITLETFRGGRINIKNVLLNILKNPLMIGAIAGVFSLVLGVRLPGFIESAVDELAALAVPLALIVMGATFTLKTVKYKRMQLILTVAMRLVVYPLIFVAIAVLLGFRNIELATLMVVFATPTAVVSYPMAEAMGCDGDFACDVVVFTTIVSSITVFLFTFFLQYFGYISLM